jgi:hypothetical protein
MSLKLVSKGPKSLREILNGIINWCNKRERISAAYPIVVKDTSDGVIIYYSGDENGALSTVVRHQPPGAVAAEAVVLSHRLAPLGPQSQSLIRLLAFKAQS